MAYTISEICNRIKANRNEILKKALKEYMVKSVREKIVDTEIEFDVGQEIELQYTVKVSKEAIEIASKTIDAVIEFLEWERVKDRIEKIEEKD